MELEPRTTVPAHATGSVEFVPLAVISDDATFRLRDEGDVSALAASIGRLGQLVPLEVRPLPGAPAEAPRFQLVSGFRRLAALRLLARDRALARVHHALSDEDAWAVALAEVLLREPLLGSEIEALRERLPGTGAAAWAEELLAGAAARAPVDPAQRERFLEFLSRPPRAEEGEVGGEAAADREDGAEGEAEGAGEGAGEAEAEGEGDREAEGEGEGEAAADREAEAEGEDEGTVEIPLEEFARELPRRMFEVNQDLALAIEAWSDLPADARLTIMEQARWVAKLLPALGGGEVEE